MKYFQKLHIIFLYSFCICSIYNDYLWNGVSISTSDNLDALHLNPAGLGIKRANQFGIAIKEHPYSNNYYIALSKR